jgi:tetratricopeptide (TPR) repeat protein
VLRAYRPEEIAASGSAASFLDHLPNLTRDLLSLPLSGLSPGAISELFSDEELADAVLSETQGNALALAEVIRALSEGGVIESDAGGRWRGRIPGATEVAHETARAGQRRAIQARVARHSRRQREVLSLLALLGREVPARILAVAAGRDQTGILHDLDALARASLVRLGDRGWTSQHQVVAEIVADGLSRAERGRLHELLAHALRIDEADLSELARHLAAAGDVEAAADAFAQAAFQSLERFASEEAEGLADAGLDLRPKRSAQAALLEIRAESRARRGELSGARDDLADVLRGKPSGPERAAILARAAMLMAGAEDYVRASELAELALAEAGSDRRARAQALTAAGRLDMNINNLDRAEARSAEALALFQQIGDPRGVAEVLDNQANIAIHLGRLRDAVLLLERVIRLFRDTGNLLRVGTLLANYGRGLVLLQERPEEGLARIEEALELERSLGHPEGQAYCLWARSEVLVELGRHSEGEENARAALAMARHLGHREWTAAALKGLGSAYLAAGDLDAAEAAFRECLEGARDLPIFISLAAAGLASVFLARHNLGAAQAYATRALEEGTEFTRYDARLVHAQIAVARGDPNDSDIVSEALALAEAGGHLLSAAQLRELARGLSDNPP